MRKCQHENTLRANAEIAVLPLFFFALLLLVCITLISYLVVISEKVNGLGMLLFKGELKQIVSTRTGMVMTWFKEDQKEIQSDFFVMSALPYPHKLVHWAKNWRPRSAELALEKMRWEHPQS